MTDEIKNSGDYMAHKAQSEKFLKMRRRVGLNYYNKNKDEINKKRREKIKNCETINCECGGHYKDYNQSMNAHIKSKKHTKFLEEENKKKNNL